MLKKTSAEKSEHFYAVIMAGGSGTRLWPLSRKATPKQFHNFVSEQGITLLEETWKRVSAALPDTSHLYICTASQYRDKILSILPALSPEQLIIEPEARGTAAAIALSADTIATRDPDALVATIPSDHMIANDDAFVEALRAAFDTVAKFPERILTIGINPTAPDTGFGYIKMGEEIAATTNHRVFSIDAFKEKPDLHTAETYLKNWEYLWNAGYFIFSARALDTYSTIHTPALARAIKDMRLAAREDMRDRLYRSVPNDPIDTAIMEKLSPEECAVIPAPLEWSDVGNWSAIFDLLEKRHETSVIARGEHVDIGSKKCLVLSNTKLIATIGLKDIVVVETDDCILVASKAHVPNIKKLLEKIKEEKGEKYL